MGEVVPGESITNVLQEDKRTQTSPRWDAVQLWEEWRPAAEPMEEDKEEGGK